MARQGWSPNPGMTNNDDPGRAELYGFRFEGRNRFARLFARFILLDRARCLALAEHQVGSADKSLKEIICVRWVLVRSEIAISPVQVWARIGESTEMRVTGKPVRRSVGLCFIALALIAAVLVLQGAKESHASLLYVCIFGGLFVGIPAVLGIGVVLENRRKRD